MTTKRFRKKLAYYHFGCRVAVLAKVRTVYIRKNRRVWVPIGVRCERCGAIALIPDYYPEYPNMEKLEQRSVPEVATIDFDREFSAPRLWEKLSLAPRAREAVKELVRTSVPNQLTPDEALNRRAEDELKVLAEAADIEFSRLFKSLDQRSYALRG